MDTQATTKARGVGLTRQGAPGATVPSAQRGGRARGAVLAAVVAGALGGCGNRSVALDAPVQWWHDLEGGTIAQQRPPPPGVGQPYPKIGTVPARPALPDAATRTGQTDRLAAQREQVERTLTRTPLPAPGTATAQALASEGVVPAVAGAAPGGPAPAGTAPAGVPAAAAAAGAAPGGGAPSATTPGAGTPGAATPGAETGAAAADPNLASATLDAAAAPPAAPAARARVVPPAAPSQRATPQELAALRDSAPAEGAPLVPAGQTADVGVMLPPVAAEPPPAPSFEVAVAPAGVAADAPPPAAREPLSRATPLEPLSRRGTPVRFQPGSALLLPDQAGVLRAFAGRRGKAPVAVTGYGDAGADTPDAQSDALSLGLQRAQAMSAVLGTYGVPAGEIRIAAEAFGRGGTVRLLH